MRKEVLFAIIAGITIGLVIAFGAWNVSKVINKKDKVEQVQKTPPPKNNLGLSLTNLENLDIITSESYLLKGITSPNSPVIVSTIEEDFFTTSKQDGSFEIEVSFPAGLSQVKINDNLYLVVYSSEFEKYLGTSEEENEDVDENTTEKVATDEAEDVVREKVKQELATKSLKTTSFVGTLTDISGGNIQIKSLTGDIKQMAVGDDTTYVNTLKKNVEVKLNDLAIGDYIVAMGFINGNKVLDAKRILISSTFEENKYEQEEIEVITLSKTKLNDITLPKKWKGPNISDLEVGQKIIIVGSRDEKENYTLRSIFTSN